MTDSCVASAPPGHVYRERGTAERQRDVLDAYARAWRHAEEAAVRQILLPCWAERGRYVSPFVDPVFGVDGLTELILDHQALFPDAAMDHLGEPVLHHDQACWRWVLSSTAPIRIQGTDFGRMLSGLDVVQFGDDGRITSVVAFFDPHRGGFRTSFTRPYARR
jgi:hypothetical protein